jgi:hypothetical protein
VVDQWSATVREGTDTALDLRSRVRVGILGSVRTAPRSALAT